MSAERGIEPVSEGQRLRIGVLGDFDGVHTRSWLRWPVARGHDVHAVSFYRPREPLEGVTLHVLREAAPGEPPVRRRAGSGSRASSLLPRSIARVAHGARYRASGLRGVLRSIAPDIFHAHFVVEHGFYGALASVHPLVVTAWGSDVLVEPRRDPLSKLIARWTLGRADLVTSNSGYMAERIVALGVRASKVEVVTLGADRYDLERHADSVNLRPHDASRPETIISTRAHEPLYNVGEILDAYGEVARRRPGTRLVVANDGADSRALQSIAASSPGRVEFVGVLDRTAFRDALAGAEVFVSVPSSDATSVALLQAMAAGAFPVVSDLPAVREWIEDGVNGIVVPLHRPDALATAIRRALDDHDLRRRAAAVNRAVVEERGLTETHMARLEELYLRLAGRQ